MNKFMQILRLVLLLGSISTITNNVWATWGDDEWQKITVPEGRYTVRVNGQSRDIYPGCSTPGDSYSFYYKPGRDDRLVIFFNGGGACWNYTTCVASLQVGVPAYLPTANHPDNRPQQQDGILNLQNPDNPYRDWSMLYLPYCTGDIHTGSNDKAYYPSSMSNNGIKIRHRGFDNFLYARAWLKARYSNWWWQSGPEKILVAGSSAGAYGAALNYPYIKQAFPYANGYMLADAGNGVITDSFLDEALKGSNAAWKADQNLAPWIPGFSSLPYLGANQFAVAAYGMLTTYYSGDKFAQFTTSWDATQTFFYNIMLNSNNIQQWTNLTPQLFADWATRARTYSYISAGASNYRFNIAPTCYHTVLRSERFYSLTNQGVPFVEWLHGMTSDSWYRARNWKNLSCNPGSDCPPPSAAEVAACLQIPANN